MLQKFFIFLMLTVLLTACTTNSDTHSYEQSDSTSGSNYSTGDTVEQSGNLAQLDENDYMCSFEKGIEPFSIDYNGSSPADSIIDKRFIAIWEFVLGNEPDDVSVYADADQGSKVYQYACAYSDITSAGRIRKFIRYKIDGVSKLLADSNKLFFWAIALHEFGHLNFSHSFSPLSLAGRELAADSYAGFMMGKYFHISKDSVSYAFRKLTVEHPTDGYPDQSSRILAAVHGWDKSQITTALSLSTTFMGVRGESNGFAGLNDRWQDYFSLSDAIKFNKSEQRIALSSLKGKLQRVFTEASSSPGEFYIDSGFLYVSINDTLSPVGTVIPSNKHGYTKMIVDSLYNYIYIDDKNPQKQKLVNLDLSNSKIEKITKVGSILSPKL